MPTKHNTFGCPMNKEFYKMGYNFYQCKSDSGKAFCNSKNNPCEDKKYPFCEKIKTDGNDNNTYRCYCKNKKDAPYQQGYCYYKARYDSHLSNGQSASDAFNAFTWSGAPRNIYELITGRQWGN